MSFRYFDALFFFFLYLYASYEECGIEFVRYKYDLKNTKETPFPFAKLKQQYVKYKAK